MSGFFYGFWVLWRGIAAFYSRPRWWLYGVLPMVLTLGCYLAVIFGYVEWVIPWIDRWISPEGGATWKLFYQSLRIAVYVGGGMGMLLVMVLLTTSLYELFGGWFFDGLIARCEREFFGLAAHRVAWRKSIGYTAQSVKYSVGTLVWIVGLLTVSWVPVAGAVLSLLIVGRRLALSYFCSVGFYHDLTLVQQKQILKSDRGVLTGFGVGVYLVLSIPGAIIVALPGIIIGSVLIYRRCNLKKQLKTAEKAKLTAK